MEPEPQPAAAGATSPTRLLFAAGRALDPSEPNPHSLLLIGPGSGAKMNGQVYAELEHAGYTVHQVHDQDTGYDVDPSNPSKYRYPRDWDRLGASLMPAAGVRDLASLARDLVWPKLLELVSKGEGPAAVLCGSRGGQVTVGELWDNYWEGPTLIINAGCHVRRNLPAVPMALATSGRDFFETRSIAFTQKELVERCAGPVLHYHHSTDGHMPLSLMVVIVPLVRWACAETEVRATSEARQQALCDLDRCRPPGRSERFCRP